MRLCKGEPQLCQASARFPQRQRTGSTRTIRPVGRLSNQVMTTRPMNNPINRFALTLELSGIRRSHEDLPEEMQVLVGSENAGLVADKLSVVMGTNLNLVIWCSLRSAVPSVGEESICVQRLALLSLHLRQHPAVFL